MFVSPDGVLPDGVLPDGVKLLIAPNAPLHGHNLPTLDMAKFHPAKLFSPPSATDTPTSLYSIGLPTNWCKHRFIRNTDPQEILIYTDGACLNNARESPKGGCGIVFSTTNAEKKGSFSFRLEAQGPDGTEYVPTSNRAELRAAIAALQYRVWYGEGARRIVIAMDSLYVVSGSTRWVLSWLKNGWKTSKRSPVKNRDLWELQMAEVSRIYNECMRLFGEKVEMLFWHIPRSKNSEADTLAKKATAIEEGQAKFRQISGIAV